MLSKKLAAMEHIQNKLTAIRNLIARNSQASDRCGEGGAPKRLLTFPFIFIGPSEEQKNGFRVSLEEDQKRAVFQANCKLVLLGDVDVCSFLGHLINQ